MTFSARNLFIGSAVLIGIGSLGPWATTILVSVRGTDVAAGRITLGCAAIILLLAFNNAPRWVLALVVLIAGAIGAGNLANVSHDVASDDGLAQVGWGLYAVVIGAGVGVLALFNPARRPNPVAAEASEVTQSAAGADTPATLEPTKRCPDCAELVLAAARVCKHCHHRFDEDVLA